MFRRVFLIPALERAAKSAAQAVIGLILGDLGFDVWQADWRKALGVAAGAALLSLLTSVASYKAGPTGSPSLVDDPAAAAEPAQVPEAPAHVRRVRRADAEHRLTDAEREERLRRGY